MRRWTVITVVLGVVLMAASVYPNRSGAQGDELGPLGDDFSDTARLAQWRRHDVVEGWPNQSAVLDVNTTSAGALYWEPYTSVWYAGFRAPFLYKEVSGDFVITTRLRAAGKKADEPDVEGSLAGLMIREPRTGTAETWKPEDESYVSFTAGLASGPGGNGPALEITVTTKGHSALEWRTGRSGWVDLRLARIGSSIVLLHRFGEGRWIVTHLDRTVLGRFGGMRPGLIEHPGLGRTLQAGITAMTDWATIRGKYDGLSPTAPFRAFNATVVRPPEGTPDLRAYFDYVQFRRITLPTALAGRGPAGFTSEEWLGVLGE